MSHRERRSAATGNTPDAKTLESAPADPAENRCRVCGCTDDDCLRCMLRTGEPCFWFEPDLCSACV